MSQTCINGSDKEAVSFSVNSQLLVEAKQLNINLSATFESALEAEVKAQRSANWLKENKAGLQALNDFVDEHGMFNHKGKM